jgi:hypothetical protein
VERGIRGKCLQKAGELDWHLPRVASQRRRFQKTKER